MSLALIQEDAATLAPHEKRELIEWLWESLIPEEGSEEMLRREAQWAAEAEDRLAAVERGELALIDGEEALRSVREALQAMRQQRQQRR